MLKRLFDRLKGDAQGVQPDSRFEPHMPEVDLLPDLEAVFDQARKAAGEGDLPPGTAGRHVIIVTPGRMLTFQPCPSPGSMPKAQVSSIEQMISPATKRNIAVIAHTSLEALTADVSRAIPFLGILIGFAYIGHAVWVFEGHASALAAGCRAADVLIVDGGMVPHLSQDWMTVASSVMRKPEIYIHDRATYSLRPARRP